MLSVKTRRCATPINPSPVGWANSFTVCPRGTGLNGGQQKDVARPTWLLRLTALGWWEGRQCRSFMAFALFITDVTHRPRAGASKLALTGKASFAFPISSQSKL